MTHPWASRDDQKQSSVLHGTLLGKDVCGDFVYVLLPASLYLCLCVQASCRWQTQRVKVKNFARGRCHAEFSPRIYESPRPVPKYSRDRNTGTPPGKIRERSCHQRIKVEPLIRRCKSWIKYLKKRVLRFTSWIKQNIWHGPFL